MAFEELPAEYDEFFKTGVLPDALKPAPAPSPAATPAPTPAPAPSATAAAPTPDPTSQAASPAPTPAPDLSVYERALRLAEDQRKALEAQLAEVQGKVAKLTEVPAPDPNVDPLGYINHQMKQLQDQISGLTKSNSDAQTLQQQQQQQTQFLTAVNAQIKAFEANTPDYQDAYRHMIQMRTQDYIESGMTPTEAKAAIGNDELAIAARALQQGKNPAEIVYNMAKRYGYQKTDPVAKPTDTADKLAKIKEGLEASKTVERGDQPVDASLDNIENMSDADLDKLVQNDWEKIFGKQKGIFGS